MGRAAGFRVRYRPTTPYRNKSGGDVRIVLYMDEETYQQIDAAARQNDCSLSSQALLFIEIGIETLALEEQGH